MAEDFVVCRVEELPPGERKIVDVNGRSIGVFNIKGKYFALRNICPHQYAPLCEGRVTGTSLPSQVGEYLYGREGEIICCPWHGWEFDILTGRSIFNPHKVRVKTYEVTVKDSCNGCETEPSVETFPVTVKGDVVVLHI
jgi:3-phenylpropionate/trans-cinnamate dioxygenase ferredoxin subunit